MRVLALLLTLAVGSGTAIARDQAQGLRIGLLPHISPALLVRTYQPLLDYLAKRLGAPLKVATAPDFETYDRRASEGRYDLYLTAPHLAALAAQRNGHRPLGRFARPLHAVIVAASDSPFTTLDNLRGHRVATPDRLAVITLLGEAALQGEGIAPDRELQLLPMSTHNAAMLAVLAGNAEAAIAGVSAFDKMPVETRSRLRVIQRTPAIPHMIFMAGPNLDDGQARAVREYLLAFNARGDGADYFSTAGKPFSDLVSVTETDLQSLAPLVARLLTRKNQ